MFKGRLGSRRRRVFPIQQMEAAECGMTCLAMVMDYYGASVPLEELRLECGTSRDGNSAVQFVEAAQRYGFKACGMRLGLEQLQQNERPLILHWNLTHCVVLERWSRGRALLVDPASGRSQLELEQVSRAFSGIALE